MSHDEESRVIRRRAIRLEQTDRHPLYLFSLTGNEILSVAEISRVSRDDDGKLLGYQRAEVKRHVGDIVDYLNSEAPLFPNSLIFALSSDVKFVRSRGPQVDDGLTQAGTIEIPIPADGEKKPAWIVDGQQRALALSKSKRRDFPLPVSAFVADEVDVQRDQFLRVNNTKPLPRGLITELLPDVSSPLPAKLAAKKIPSAICDLLNSDEASPFFGMIRRSSASPDQKRTAVISDGVVVKMVEESLSQFSGCLFPYRNLATGQTDSDMIMRTLIVFWSAVKNAFPDAWGRPPTESRLMHGAGIRAMGRLMDKITPGIDVRQKRAVKEVEEELTLVAPVCRWTDGHWGPELSGMGWNEVQLVPRHISNLSNFLIRTYLQKKGVMG